jgi:glycosyltransferase involved in cell wall biosynthesis
MTDPYSIVITTFDQRFEPFLKPLITQIQAQRPDIEIIVMINGLCKAPFNPSYRQQILNFLADHANCYPTVFPSFQSLAKMWNRGILNASNERVLVLNDDLRIHPSTTNPSRGFFEDLEQSLTQYPRSFKVNGSFSHYVINRTELIEVGFFDERLLGLGEEDGDFYWRYHEHYGSEIESIDIPGIDNVQSDLADIGYTKGIRTAALFNRQFIKGEKYREVLLGGYRGMFDKRVKKQIADEKQYPYENFYLTRRDEV